MTSAVASEAPFRTCSAAAWKRLPDEPGWLRDLRRKGSERFLEAGFPGPSEEAWRFTSLKGLRKIDFVPDTGEGNDAGVAPLVADADARLEIAGGGVSDLRSPGAESGVQVEGLARAVAGEAPPPVGSRVDLDRHRFSALNTALWTDGAHVRVAPGIEKPLLVHLVFRSPVEGIRG